MPSSGVIKLNKHLRHWKQLWHPHKSCHYQNFHPHLSLKVMPWPLGLVLCWCKTTTLLHSSAAQEPWQVGFSIWREMLASLFAVEKWRYYLIGRKTVIKTDHKPLKYLLEQGLCTEGQHTWLLKLHSHKFKVEHKKGKKNVAADNLSRKLDTGEPTVFMITTVESDWLKQLKAHGRYSWILPRPQRLNEKLTYWIRGSTRREEDCFITKIESWLALCLLSFLFSWLSTVILQWEVI